MKSLFHMTALSFLVLVAASVAAQEYRWELTNDNPPSSLPSQGDEFFANKVKELSGGSIEVTVHHAGALGFRSKDNLDVVEDGAAQIATTFASFIAGVEPIFSLSSLPFITGAPEDAKAAINIAWKHLDEAFARHGQKLLYTAPYTPVGIWAKKPITSKEQLAGLKIRTYDAFGTYTLSAAGAVPLQLSWGDIVPQLTTGGIEAVFTSAEGGSGAKFWEHLDHFTELNYSTGVAITHMNRDAFNKLSESEKEAVTKAANATNERNWEALDGRLADRYKEMREHGVTIVTDVPADFKAFLRDKALPQTETWKKDVGKTASEIMAELAKQ